MRMRLVRLNALLWVTFSYNGWWSQFISYITRSHSILWGSWSICTRNRRFNAFFSLFSPLADKHAEQRVVHEAGLGEYSRDERLISVKNFRATYDWYHSRHTVRGPTDGKADYAEYDHPDSFPCQCFFLGRPQVFIREFPWFPVNPRETDQGNVQGCHEGQNDECDQVGVSSWGVISPVWDTNSTTRLRRKWAPTHKGRKHDGKSIEPRDCHRLHALVRFPVLFFAQGKFEISVWSLIMHPAKDFEEGQCHGSKCCNRCRANEESSHLK